MSHVIKIDYLNLVFKIVGKRVKVVVERSVTVLTCNIEIIIEAIDLGTSA